jgi:hypothetical protein
MRLSLFALVLVTTSLVAPAALAIDKCKVKVRKDGTLLFSARKISDNVTLRWSWEPTVGTYDGEFNNIASCLSKGKAKKCTLGPNSSLYRVVPPPLCTLYVTEVESPTMAESVCSVRLKKCTPAVRPLCPPHMDRVGAFCVDKQVREPSTLVTAMAACQAEGRSVCSFQALSQCDTLNIGACGTATDGDLGTPLWTSDTAAEDDDNLFNRIIAWAGVGNTARELDDDQDLARYFCCQSVSGQPNPN